MKKFAIIAGVASCLAAVAPETQARPYAIFHTTAGDFTAELYPDKAPRTVENFVGLAKGTKPWKHPATNEVMEGKPLYDNTKFHRTIPGFMIQGGDPLGTGAGGPGYEFPNEDSDLTFDRAGRLAMANRGRDTNGSQFFVTVGPRPQLNRGYTIFGQVLSGMDVVNKIVNLPSEPESGRALQPVTLKSVEIVDQLPGDGIAAEDKATTPADAQTSPAR